MSRFPDVPNVQAVAREMSYTLKPQGASGRRYRINISPYNSVATTLNSTNLGQFYFPRRQNSVLDTQSVYLKGSATIPAQGAGVVCSLNRNAYALINRLSVYAQDSLLVEDITNYNELLISSLDAQLNHFDKLALSSVLGCYDGGITTATNNIQVDLGQQSTANTSMTVDFAIPIICGTVGGLAEKNFPMGAISSDMRLDIYFETAQKSFRRSDAADVITGYTLSNLEIICDYIELDAPIIPLNQPIFVHTTSYRGYNFNFPSGTNGYYSSLIPHRSLSVKSVFLQARRGTTQNIDFFNRVNPYGTTNLNISFMVGGERQPSRPIQSSAELFQQLQLAYHSMGDLICNGSMSKSQYEVWNATAPAIANAGCQKALIGYNFDLYQKKSETVNSGSNWSGINVFIEGQVSESGTAQTALSTSLTATVHVHFDMILIIKDGLVDVRF